MKSLKHIISAVIAAILLLSMVFALTGCSSGDIVAGSSGVGTQPMEYDEAQAMDYKDFFDLEKTHKPTDEEVRELSDHINEQWARVFLRWEELGSPEIGSYVDFADEQGIALVTFADVVAAIGRPHQNDPYTGRIIIQWETTSGYICNFTFTTSSDAPRYGEYTSIFWLYEHYGVVESYLQGVIPTIKEEGVFDLEKTHKPTDDEVTALCEFSNQSAFNDGLPLKFAYVVEVLGRPHGYGDYSGRFSFGWETESGSRINIPVGLPDGFLSDYSGWSEENRLWVYYCFGEVEVGWLILPAQQPAFETSF